MNKFQLIVRECVQNVHSPLQTPAMREVYDEVMECAIKEYMKRISETNKVTYLFYWN